MKQKINIKKNLYSSPFSHLSAGKKKKNPPYSK